MCNNALYKDGERPAAPGRRGTAAAQTRSPVPTMTMTRWRASIS